MNNPTTILLAFCFGAFSLVAQNPARSGRDHAVFFYATTFQPGWEALPDTKKEAEALAAELRSNYGFTVELVANPTKTAIKNKILELNQGKYGPNDQLLLFFSMHGHLLSSADRGYLIPTDGKAPAGDPLGDTWLSYDDLGAYLALNSCRHILLLLDACYSGAFGDRWKGYPGDVPPNPGDDCKAREANALFHQSRLYFSSGSRTRRTPAQSKFAGRLLEALREGRSRKLVASNELRYFFGTIEDPQPEGGTFSKNHQAGGDFIFLHKIACGAAPPVPPADQLTDREFWLQAKAADTQAAFLNYLERFPEGEFRPLAEQRLTQLRAERREAEAWSRARQTNTREGYDAFLRDFPQSVYRDLALHYRGQINTAPVSRPTADLPGMILVKGGEFQMGSNEGESDEKPVHKVTVSDFYLSIHELTFDEYDIFCAETGKEKPGDEGYGRGKRPVINVRWEDAIAYCNWRSEQEGLRKVYVGSGAAVKADWSANGYRLPTEAEWEFAARSRGQNDKWAGTSTDTELAAYANGNGKDNYSQTAPVGSFRPNALGLYDMSGNVWEWCWDWYGAYSSSGQTDPKGPSLGSNRVLRGGSWFHSPARLRCADRYSLSPAGFRGREMGFRVARGVN